MKIIAQALQFSSRFLVIIAIMQTEKQNFINDLKQSDPHDHDAIIDKCVLNVVKQENYTTFDVTKKCMNTNGGNYLGTIYEVDIKGETTEGSKVTPIFIKTLAPEHNEIEILSLTEIYKREDFVYFELSKIFHELEDEAQVPMEERYKIAKAYAVSIPKTLFLENVTRRGFQTRHRMDVITLDFAEASLKELAKFHALSFILKEKRPNYFYNSIRTIKSSINFEKPWKEYVDTFLNLSLKYLNTEVTKEIEDQLRSITGKCSKYFMAEEDGISCLCHGDYRPNNLLFKEVDGKVTEILPVDYQLAFYGCPVLDIIYFIYMSTDLKFRQNHLQHLKKHYYDSFEKFLGLFNLSVDTVFSRRQFDRLFADKSDFGLMMTILFLPLQFTSEDNVPDIKKDAISDWNMKLDDKFRDRFNDAVKEFISI